MPTTDPPRPPPPRHKRNNREEFQYEHLRLLRTTPSDPTCSICQEPFVSSIPIHPRRAAIVTNFVHCSHVFCISCIQRWLDTANTCPMCRAEFFNKFPSGPSPLLIQAQGALSKAWYEIARFALWCPQQREWANKLFEAMVVMGDVISQETVVRLKRGESERMGRARREHVQQESPVDSVGSSLLPDRQADDETQLANVRTVSPLLASQSRSTSHSATIYSDTLTRSRHELERAALNRHVQYLRAEILLRRRDRLSKVPSPATPTFSTPMDPPSWLDTE